MMSLKAPFHYLVCLTMAVLVICPNFSNPLQCVIGKEMSECTAQELSIAACRDLSETFLLFSKRIVNPVECDDALADAASEIVTIAYQTITDTWKRAMHDEYLVQSACDVPFHVWLEATGNTPPMTPNWIKHLLDCPCGAVIGLTVFIPVTIVFAFIYLVTKGLQFPFRACSKGATKGNREEHRTRENVEDGTNMEPNAELPSARIVTQSSVMHESLPSNSITSTEVVEVAIT